MAGAWRVLGGCLAGAWRGLDGPPNRGDARAADERSQPESADRTTAASRTSQRRVGADCPATGGQGDQIGGGWRCNGEWITRVAGKIGTVGQRLTRCSQTTYGDRTQGAVPTRGRAFIVLSTLEIFPPFLSSTLRLSIHLARFGG